MNAIPNLLIELRFRSGHLDRTCLRLIAESFAKAAFSRRGSPRFSQVLLLLHGDRASRAAHAAVMGVPTPTDVITIPYEATPFEPAHAELLVNPMQAARCALSRDPETLLPEERSIPWSPSHELALYIAHGFDHLTGADDASPADYRKMRRRELKWLATLPANLLSNLFTP